ncbi:phosphate signaling complex protein PhoU, partial [Candidatus Bathyarchaeota archaeon]|nr:phosphate signaling complex protein PhoU [Candidatus Bathyarchaeota archaeon]
EAVSECLKGGDAYDKIREISDALGMMAEEVEDKAFGLIARFQPVASDLRTINSYIKIAYDFTRFGRYALDISQANKKLGSLKDCNESIHNPVEEMSSKTLSMIRTSIGALKSHNAKLAEKIADTEIEVDQLYEKFIDKLTGKTKADIKCIIAAVLVTRYLERIADHATYICESIVYIVTGKKIILDKVPGR